MTDLVSQLVGALEASRAYIARYGYTGEQLAIIDAALTAAKAGGWLPIETAPKDSTARLVWCPERQNIYAVTWLPKVGWVIFGGRALSELPTKWQPLPNPPKEQA